MLNALALALALALLNPSPTPFSQDCADNYLITDTTVPNHGPLAPAPVYPPAGGPASNPTTPLTDPCQLGGCRPLLTTGTSHDQYKGTYTLDGPSDGGPTVPS